jgi:hypothetical protein
MENPYSSSPRGHQPPAGTIVALAELSERLDDMRSLVEASTAVAAFVVGHLGSDLAGVSVREPDGRPVRLAASNSVLVQLDAVETGLPGGPGTAQLDDGAAITIADTRADRLWPAWSSAAAERDVLSVRLLWMPRLRGRSVTLQLFSHRADAFAPGDLAGTAAVAKLAGLALRHVDRLANLEEAIATRDLIGQAQGIIMERYGLNSEQAMRFLRRSSQHSQEKVRNIAERLVFPGTPDV